jgi:imidazolonepropionase-like amidohydrolase
VVVIRIRGYALPHAEYVDLYADGDRWTTDPVPGAELVAEGWLLPGLVDVHTHPGVTEPGQSLDPTMLRAHLHQHVEGGAAAVEAGVRVLAGTDSLPHGEIVGEVHALAGAGLSPHDALAAASWGAREYLGLPGLEAGAPADAVVYARDPRVDLGVLADPAAVVLRGRLVRGRG